MINIFDRTLKVIARNHAATFLRLAFPKHQARLIGTQDNVEISLSVKPVDFVHEVVYAEEHFTLHLEFQLEHKAEIPQRSFITSAELTEQFKRPVLTVLIYLQPRHKEIPKHYVTKLGKRVINQFSYPVIKLWEHVNEIRQGHLRELAPLLPMLVPNPDEVLLAEVKTLILQEPDDQKRADLLASAVTIGIRYFDKAFLWRFFREEVEQMKQAHFIDDWLEEREIIGFERGRLVALQERTKTEQESIQQGQQLGQLLMARENISRILLNRFDPSARALKAVEQQLAQINDIPLLQTLFDEALFVESLPLFATKVAQVVKPSVSQLVSVQLIN